MLYYHDAMQVKLLILTPTGDSWHLEEFDLDDMYPLLIYGQYAHSAITNEEDDSSGIPIWSIVLAALLTLAVTFILTYMVAK